MGYFKFVGLMFVGQVAALVISISLWALIGIDPFQSTATFATAVFFFVVIFAFTTVFLSTRSALRALGVTLGYGIPIGIVALGVFLFPQWWSEEWGPLPLIGAGLLIMLPLTYFWNRYVLSPQGDVWILGGGAKRATPTRQRDPEPSSGNTYWARRARRRR